VTPTRTVIVGSALPLLILVGLVAFPSARTAVGLERSEPVPRAGTSSAEAAPISFGTTATAAERVPLDRLRRSIRAGRDLAFTGTEIVSTWRPSGATTRVLDLVQRSGGVRTATAHDTADGEPQVTEWGSVTDGLAGLSDRALAVLVAGYDLRTGGSGRVAGRSATVVVAARDGREVARMWLDDRTGLLLREDLLDGAGRLHRMATFVDLQVSADTTDRADPLPRVPTGPLSSPVRVLNRSTPTPSHVGDPWSDVVSPAELSSMRADGWPCPTQLPAGFVLLDARRAEVAGGRSAVHLTYGDGLSAISVFLQRGRLDDARIPGLTRQKWGKTDVYVRDGPPEVMVWQGGSTVITVVGDATPTDLRVAVSALPRQPDPGTLDLLQQRMGSALAWFKG